MGFANESREGLVAKDAEATVSLAAVADNLRLFRIMSPITVLRVGFLLTTAPTVTPPVVDFDRRILIASDVGRIDQGVTRMTFPAVASTPIGAVVYKDVNVDLDAGDEVSVQVVTAATAGAGIPFMEYIPRSVMPSEDLNYVKAT